MLEEFPDLKIHGREGDPFHILVFFVVVDRFQLREVFYNLPDFRWSVFILGTFGAHMSRLSAVEAESFLHALLAFLGHELSYFDDIYVHGVGITSFGGGGERVVGLVGGFRVSFGDFFSALPLGVTTQITHDSHAVFMFLFSFHIMPHALLTSFISVQCMAMPSFLFFHSATAMRLPYALLRFHSMAVLDARSYLMLLESRIL